MWRKQWNAGESNDERLLVNHSELGFSGIFRELGQFCKGLTGLNRIAKPIGLCRGSVFHIGSSADEAKDRDQNQAPARNELGELTFYIVQSRYYFVEILFRFVPRNLDVICCAKFGASGKHFNGAILFFW